MFRTNVLILFKYLLFVLIILFSHHFHNTHVKITFYIQKTVWNLYIERNEYENYLYDRFDAVCTEKIIVWPKNLPSQTYFFLPEICFSYKNRTQSIMKINIYKYFMF